MPHDLSPLSYHAMRLRWCRFAVKAFLRRWSVYLVVLGVLFSAGSVGALSSVSALAAWLVLPFFYAVAHPSWLPPAAAFQLLLNLAVLWGLRALLWRTDWADAERALPLPPRALLRSDAVMALLALAPIFLLQGLGAAVLLGQDPPWLHGVRLRAAMALALVLLASLAVGVALLQRRRRAPRAVRSTHQALAASRPLMAIGALKVLPWRPALVWLPLLRGTARRTGRGLLGFTALLGLPAVAAVLRPGDTPWWLAAYLLASLVATSRLQALARLELEPLWRQCAMLPLAGQQLVRMRRLCAACPAAVGGLLLLACLPFGAMRLPMFAAYAATCATAQALIVFCAPGRPSTEASRWLFFLALGLVLASEVMVT